MDDNSYLNPNDISDQCDTAINKLNRDNDAIQIVEEKLNEFINDSELQSEAFDALKIQISDYNIVLQAMRSSNDSDIYDFTTLKGSVGSDILIGADILSQQKSALSEKESDENHADHYDNLSSNTIFPWMSWYYGWKASQYRDMAQLDQDMYDKWKEKEEQYDDIESNTRSLFSGSSSMRQIVKTALSSINGSFQDGTYNTDNNNSWKTELSKCYLNRIITVDEDGSITPNWTEVRKIMSKDASDITDEEYRTLSFLYLNLDNQDFAEFLGLCMNGEDVNVPWYNEFFGPTAGQVNQDYSKWTVDTDKVDRILYEVANTDAQMLYLLQHIDNDSALDETLNTQLNQIIQRQTLLLTVEGIGEFHGQYKNNQPNISIEQTENQLIVLNFKEYRNIGSDLSPVFSNLGDSSISISDTYNGVNNMSIQIENSELQFYGYFGDVNEVAETSSFVYDEINGEIISKGSEDLAKYVVDKTSSNVLGKAVGFIPYAGDIIGFGIDLAEDEVDVKENNDFITKQFDSLKAANIYSDFGCSTSYVQYNISENKDIVVYSYEGEHTQDIITAFNNEFNTNYSVKDVVSNPDSIWQKKSEFDLHMLYRYNQIINKND